MTVSNTEQQATEFRATNSDQHRAANYRAQSNKQWRMTVSNTEQQATEFRATNSDQHRAANYRVQSNKQWWMTVSNTEQQATELRATNSDEWQCSTQSSKLQSSEQQTVTNDSVQHRVISQHVSTKVDKLQISSKNHSFKMKGDNMKQNEAWRVGVESTHNNGGWGGATALSVWLQSQAPGIGILLSLATRLGFKQNIGYVKVPCVRMTFCHCNLHNMMNSISENCKVRVQLLEWWATL